MEHWHLEYEVWSKLEPDKKELIVSPNIEANSIEGALKQGKKTFASLMARVDQELAKLLDLGAVVDREDIIDYRITAAYSCPNCNEEVDLLKYE